MSWKGGKKKNPAIQDEVLILDNRSIGAQPPTYY